MNQPPPLCPGSQASRRRHPVFPLPFSLSSHLSLLPLPVPITARTPPQPSAPSPAPNPAWPDALPRARSHVAHQAEPRRPTEPLPRAKPSRATSARRRDLAKAKSRVPRVHSPTRVMELPFLPPPLLSSMKPTPLMAMKNPPAIPLSPQRLLFSPPSLYKYVELLSLPPPYPSSPHSLSHAPRR
jgi:hypothetical protein